MSRESNKQENINPTMLKSNNETKPTESIKQDSIQETSISTESNKLESKKPNDTKNKDNIKLDSNGDEIIWELKQNITILFLLGYLFYLSMIFGFMYILIIYMIPNIIHDWKPIFISLFLIYGIICLSREIYYSLNLKTMYITKDNLFIKKYLGQDLELALKDCIIFTRMVTGAVNIAGVSTCEINTINNHSTLYIFLESSNTNIEETNILLKPFIINHLLNCNEKSYNQFKIRYRDVSIKRMYDIDYKDIDKLREQKANNG